MTDEAKAERAAVVAWLRNSAAGHIGAMQDWFSPQTIALLEDDASMLEELANAIERGDHLAVRQAITERDDEHGSR